MNLRDLRYLVAVAETKHFGRAALAENVSQPALSAQIRKLEAFLGVTLFERDSRNVALTPAGEAILAAARSVLTHAASIEAIASDFRDPLAGPFRVGIIASLGPFLAAELLVQLQHDAPRLAVFLTEGLTDDLLASLRAGDLDAALIATAPPDDRLHETGLFDEPFLLAHAPDHPLTKLDRPTMADVEAGTLLLLGEGHCLRNQALSLCGSASVDGRVTSTSLVTLMRLAGSGHGVTLVPALAAGAAQGLTLRRLESPLAQRRVRLVARRQFARRGALHVAAAAVRTIAAANGLSLAEPSPGRSFAALS